MSFFKESGASIKRRPFILIFFTLMCFIVSYLQQLIYTLYKLNLKSTVDKILEFLKLFSTKEVENLSDAAKNGNNILLPDISAGNFVLSLLIALVIIFCISAIISILVSGYSHILNISLVSKEKTEGEFSTGVVKHYFKYTIYLFIHITITIIFFAAVIVACFPALLCFNMVFHGSYNQLVLPTIFFIIITALIILFAVISFTLYTSYMYPALANFRKGAFYMCRKVVNFQFWKLVPGFTVLLLLLVGWQVFMYHIEFGISTFATSIITFALNGIMTSLLGFFFFYFIFNSFKNIKNELQTIETSEQ